MFITIEPGLRQTNIIMLSTLEWKKLQKQKQKQKFGRTGALIWKVYLNLLSCKSKIKLILL